MYVLSYKHITDTYLSLGGIQLVVEHILLDDPRISLISVKIKTFGIIPVKDLFDMRIYRECIYMVKPEQTYTVCHLISDPLK